MYGEARIVQSLATELRSGPSSDPSQIVENGEEMLAVGPLENSTTRFFCVGTTLFFTQSVVV